YVRSVRGRGYQLCGAPRAIREAAPGPVRRRRALAALAAVVLAAATAAWWLRAGAPATVAPSAHEELLQRARYYAGIGQAENNERAIALYEQALETDRSDAAAAVGLSRALSARMCLYNGAPEAAVRAQSLAETVVARDPRDAAAHS